MSCAGVTCHAQATCTPVTVDGILSYTCRCNDGYTGDGFNNCELVEGIPELYLLVIILVVLLFVGLLVLVIFLLCKRRLADDGMRQQLVGTMEVTAYESKWENVAGKDEEDGPPPYEEKHDPEPDGVLGSFHPGEVTVGRVPVAAEDDAVDQTDDAKEYDNPTYDAVANVKSEVIVDDDVGGIDNPTYDADFTPAAPTEVAVEVEGAVEEEPSVEVAVEVEDPVTAPEVPEIAAEVAVAVAEEPEEEKAIAVTFTEGDLPNTVSAHVSTPEASLTINLNIALPDNIVALED